MAVGQYQPTFCIYYKPCCLGCTAGGGIKGGQAYGATDDFAWNITEDPVHVHDMQATMMHLCGIDHTRLTFPFQGLDQKLTGVEEAHVVTKILS